MSKKAVRNKKPRQSGKIKFTLPRIRSFRLENDLQVYFVQKSTLPFLNMSIVADAGSKYDPSGKKGLSNLLAMVVDEGAAEYDSLQLSDQFEILGASFNISCDQDSMFISLQVLKDEFERGLELFTSIITDSHLDEADFNREKRKVKTRILQNRDDAEEIANEVFIYKLFGAENSYAFPAIGYENDVDALSVHDLKEYYDKILRPSNSFLVVVGDYEADSLRNLLNKYLSKWQNQVLHKPELSFQMKSCPGLYIVDRKNSVQSEIRTGLQTFKRNKYDYYARNILNLILGGQFSSRLNLNLREKKGYTYGIFSRFNYLKSSAYFYISTSVSTENTGAAVNEIGSEIKRIRNGISKKELEFAKSSLIRRFPSGFESYRQIAVNIVGKVIHKLPEDYFETYLDEIRNVTSERILKAAQDNLYPEKLTTVIVGNKEKILTQINKASFGEVFELDENGRRLKKI